MTGQLLTRFAKKEDFPALTAIWQEAFGDTPEFIHHFLTMLFTKESALVLTLDGVPVSALYLLPGTVRKAHNQRSFDARYIYAAATLRQHRGKGYMTLLLEQAAALMQKKGLDFLLLSPASERLFGYYGRIGFQPAFSYKLLRLNRSQMRMMAASGGRLTALTLPGFEQLNREYLEHEHAFLWPEQVLVYAYRSYLASGGKTVAFTHNDELCGAALFREDETQDICSVTDICVKQSCFPGLADMLLEHSACEQFHLRLPIRFPLSSDRFEIVPNGMLLPLSKDAQFALPQLQQAYLGLTME